MAAGIMPELREPIVCETPCQHRDCASWRAQAELPCAICHTVIAAGGRYFVRECKDHRVTVQVHERCAMEEAEREGVAHRWATSDGR